MRIFFLFALASFFFSCERGNVYKYKADKNSSNLKFYAGTIFYNETIFIKYNDDLIFKYTMDSVKGYPYAFQCNREFSIPYTDKFTISISTMLNGKTYLDTTMKCEKSNFGYHLNVSRAVPFNYRYYFEEGKIEPVKQWGYLPIDSCIRFVTIESDSVNKNTWSY